MITLSMEPDTHRLDLTGWVSALARDHTVGLARLARQEGLDAVDALDAVQEAFETLLRLPQARSLVGAPDDSRALMAAIVRNAARNARRRHHRARPHVVIDDSSVEADEATADELLARAEEHARLRGCVDHLATIQRRVVTMRMFEELSPASVAGELALDQGHVAVLLHRAKRELLRCMTDRADDGGPHE